MNKHDFYKQLMSEYSFDTDKIRENAKKGKFARQKISPIAIGITAAVAACTVACGTVAISMMESKNGVDLIDTSSQSLSALSASERVQNAIEQQSKAKDSEEIQSVLVTFCTPLSPKGTERVLTAYTDSNIPVKAVYLANGSKISGSDNVSAVFSGNDNISAICIECAGSVMSLLQSDTDVFLVELMSESDFDTATPISPDEIETTEVVIPESTNPAPEIKDDPIILPGGEEIVLPVLPETQDTFEIIYTDETYETVDVTETVDFGETLAPVETSETSDDTETQETVAPPVEPVTPETEELPPVVTPPETIAPPETNETPQQPVEPVIPSDPVIQQPPAGVVLKPDLKDFVYKTENISAVSAYFLDKYIYFVRTADSIALYEYYGTTETLVDSVPCLDSKVHWVSEDGCKLLVSGLSDQGNRSKMWLVDSQSRGIFDIHAEDAIMYGNLVSVGFDSSTDRLFFNAKLDGVYYLYALSLDGHDLSYIESPFWSEAKITMLGSSGDNIYLAVNDASLTQIYRVNILTRESNIIKTYDNNPKIVSNLAFTHAVISPADSALTGVIEIFDPATESFITTGRFDASVTFGASKHDLCIGGNFYTISNGTLVPLEPTLETLDAIDYKRSFSGRYIASAVDGCVKITSGVYNDNNKALNLVYGQVVSNASERYVDALNGAISLNNALALGTCPDVGIHAQFKLIECLNAYYSTDAVNALVALCGIDTNSLKLNYTSGKLTAVSANKTQLVITYEDSVSAIGTLYIKAGTFCGTPAYSTANVSFVKEDGVWKLGNIIR